ncbi:MAG: hypothetical protein ACXVP5_11530, partial [Tumebacillaceae bacterium]
ANASAVAGYSMSQWHTGSTFPNTQYSGTWTTYSSNNTVTINGWQEDYNSSSPAKLDYAVVQDEALGWGDHWVHQPIYGNYKYSGTWYSKQFSGIPNGITVAIALTIQTGYATDSGGNAYQTY